MGKITVEINILKLENMQLKKTTKRTFCLTRLCLTKP